MAVFVTLAGISICVAFPVTIWSISSTKYLLRSKKSKILVKSPAQALTSGRSSHWSGPAYSVAKCGGSLQPRLDHLPTNRVTQSASWKTMHRTNSKLQHLWNKLKSDQIYLWHNVREQYNHSERNRYVNRTQRQEKSYAECAQYVYKKTAIKTSLTEIQWFKYSQHLMS